VERLAVSAESHPVTRLGQEAFFHQCVKALSAESQAVFHGLFLSIDGFPSKWEKAAGPEGKDLLRRVAALLRDTHPPRSVHFHLSHAFFAVLCMGPSRREYRTLAWDLRNRLLRRDFLPDPRLGVSLGVTFWPTDACFPEPFCDLLLRSLQRSRRRGVQSVVFTEDWYRGPFGEPRR
jgi:GGDEF domain-containing protein